MRIVFMGTPDFALPSLKALINSEEEIVGVVTGPDKPRGRGQRVSITPVKELAMQKKMKILQPEALDNPDFIQQLKDLHPEVIVVVAFRILPDVICSIPPFGSFNLHASLLPQYRGAAPIQWALLNGERTTGVTTFFLERKVDTGQIILQRPLVLDDEITGGELHDQLAKLGGQVVAETIALIKEKRANPYPQDDRLATPAPKLFTCDCRIRWNCTSRNVHNQIRALSPSPGAWTMFRDITIKIYRSRMPADSIISSHRPGLIHRVAERLFVETSDGAIEVLDLQQQGHRRMKSDEFLRGFRFGERAEFE